jgi:hypothetical protein
MAVLALSPVNAKQCKVERLQKSDNVETIPMQDYEDARIHEAHSS